MLTHRKIDKKEKEKAKKEKKRLVVETA